LPCYNSERTLERTIDSLLAQTFADFELVACDNASTDRSWDILSRYAEADSRVRVYRNETNRGASVNYNRVFELSRASYFKWASSNDWCDPRLLEACIEALEAEPTAVVASPRAAFFRHEPADARPYSGGLDLRSDDPAARFIGALRIGRNIAMNGLIRSDALRRTELTRPYFGSDCVMVAALALQGKILELPHTLLYMCDTADTATSRMAAAEVRRHFTGTARAMTHQTARNWAGYWRAALSVRLNAQQRWAVTVCLAKMLRWSVADMVREARDAMRAADRRRVAGPDGQA
jgi:glycosyltransferase involved in cell wall biosynthesis